MLRYDLRHSISRNLEGRDFSLATISAMSSNLVRTADLVIYPADHFNDGEMHVYGGTAIGQSRKVSDFALEAATPPTYAQITPFIAFSPQAVAADLFEIHPHHGWSVAQLNDAINHAHYAIDDTYLADKINETLTMELSRHEYPIPTGFRYISDVQREQNPLSTWGSDKLDTWRGLHTVNAQTRLSIGFKLAATNAQGTGTWVGGVRLYLKAVGTITPVRTFTLAIQTNTAGLPSGTQVTGASATLLSSSVVATPQYYHFTFSSPVLLSDDTVYHLVLTSSQASLDATNYLAWGEDTTTSYTDAGAALYESSWTALSGSAFLFSVVRGVLDSNYKPFLLPDWDILRSSKYLWIRNPAEGYPLRLIGQGQPTVPTADTDTIYLPERYAVTKATAIACSMQPGGDSITLQDRIKLAEWWEKLAEMELSRLRVQSRPNSRIVEEK